MVGALVKEKTVKELKRFHEIGGIWQVFQTELSFAVHLKLQHYNEDGSRNIKSGRAYHATSQLVK